MPIRSIEDFLDFKREDKGKIVPMRTKKKPRNEEDQC